MRNPTFNAILQEMADLHDSKNHDYADNDNPYSNFEGAAKIAGVTVPEVFQVMIGIKVERMRQLTSGKEPNHESLADTRRDAAVYLVLWEAWERAQGHRPLRELFSANLDKATAERRRVSADILGEHAAIPWDDWDDQVYDEHPGADSQEERSKTHGEAT